MPGLLSRQSLQQLSHVAWGQKLKDLRPSLRIGTVVLVTYSRALQQ